jgi:hypothetical protein
MGGAEKATGTTSPTGEAQETEVVCGRVEGDKRSHQEALGGLPQGPQRYGVSGMSAIRRLAAPATDNGPLAPELAAGIARVKSANAPELSV